MIFCFSFGNVFIEGIFQGDFLLQFWFNIEVIEDPVRKVAVQSVKRHSESRSVPSDFSVFGQG